MGEENTEIKYMTGFSFFNDTELGKALAKRLPPVNRVIIDIPVDGPVTLYYSSPECSSLLNLNWEEVIQHLKINESDTELPARAEIQKNETTGD